MHYNDIVCSLHTSTRLFVCWCSKQQTTSRSPHLWPCLVGTVYYAIMQYMHVLRCMYVCMHAMPWRDTMHLFNNRYIPINRGSKWQKFGIRATIQGSLQHLLCYYVSFSVHACTYKQELHYMSVWYAGLCCGPFKITYGARHGKISRRCGTFMYSEIVQAKPKVYYDKKTQTAIGFLKYNSSDGWLQKGTWFTFNNKNSIEALTNFIGKS